MVYYIVKVLVSAIIIVLVSELSKKSSFIGSLLASLPLISLLAMIWLYVDTRNVGKVAELSTGIFWLVIPSLSLFLILPILLRSRINFYVSLVASVAFMVLFYYGMLLVLKKVGIKL